MESQEGPETDFDEAKFRKGVLYLLDAWPVLTMARENGWAKKNNAKMKAQASQNEQSKYWISDQDQLLEFFANELAEYTLNFDVTQFDIENFVLDYMEEKFYVNVEDESEKEIGKLVLDLYESILERKNEIFDKIEKLNLKIKKCKVVGVDSKKREEEKKEKEEEKENEERKEEKMEIEVQPIPNEPIVDEDGFTLVTKKKGKKK